MKEYLKNTLLYRMLRASKLHHFQNKWRKRNKHNFTTVNRSFPLSVVSVGKGTYGELNIVAFGEEHKICIGNYCSVAQKVDFVINADHNIQTPSSYPYKVKIMGDFCEATSKGDITVDDDVWIGYRATILSGVHIGQGAVVAAGSLINKDVPPYAVVGGVPAKIIKYRFPENIIKKLLAVDFSLFDKDFIQNNIQTLYQTVQTEEDVDALLQVITEYKEGKGKSNGNFTNGCDTDV